MSTATGWTTSSSAAPRVNPARCTCSGPTAHSWQPTRRCLRKTRSRRIWGPRSSMRTATAHSISTSSPAARSSPRWRRHLRIGSTWVTDTVWVDVDGDHRDDLVVVGEWMPITVFHNTGTRLERVATRGLEHSSGWWNRIIAADFTGDGRGDFVIGNAGLNSRLQTSAAEPLRMYVKDFDGNGFPEQILARVDGSVAHPLALRDELTAALPGLKVRYPKYVDYARQTVQDIFGDALSGALVKQVDTFASVLAKNNGDGSFTLLPLPREVQLAPVYGLLARDFDHDGRLDLLLAGNLAGVQPAFGAMTASYGLLLRGDGPGGEGGTGFTPVRSSESGFGVPGHARDIQRLRTRRGDLYIVARNNDRPLFFR